MSLISSKDWIHSLLRGFGVRLLGVVILAALIPFGSVMTLPFLLVTVLSLAVTLGAAIILEEPRATRVPFRLALFILLAACAWIGLQALRPVPAAWENPAWAAARAFIPGLAGSLSLTPGDAMPAALSLVLPFSVFLCGLVLCNSDDRARLLLSMLGTFGGLAAIFGIVQFLMAPGTLLAIDKKSYLDSLTGLFVNRNTAATFYGLAFLVNLGLLRDHALRLHWRTGKAGFADQLLLVVLPLFTFTSLVALMLTRSRAGIGASGLASLVYVPYLVADWKKQTARRRQAPWLPLAWGAGTVGLTLVLFLVFGAQAILRFKTQGVSEDGRSCILPGLLDAAGGSWMTGSGFGAFRFAFAPFRDPACGINGIFDRAHNGYLEGFIGLGLLFPVLVLLALGGLAYAFRTGWRNRRRMRHISLLGFSGLLLALVHSAFDFSLQIPGMSVYFAAFLAATVSLCMVKSRGERSAEALQEQAVLSTQGDLV